MRRHTIAEPGAHIIATLEYRRHIANQPRHNILTTGCQIRALDLHPYGDQNPQNSTPKYPTHHCEAGLIELLLMINMRQLLQSVSNSPKIMNNRIEQNETCEEKIKHQAHV